MSTDPIRDAADALRGGALVVFPTDTVYGIAARPDLPEATRSLFEAKARPAELTLPVLVATVAEARTVGVLDDRADRLAAALWPGPVTLIVPRAAASLPWDLGGQAQTVGLRIPAHPLALELLARTGPLAVTSANRSGESPGRTCDELVAAFGDAVEVYLCHDEPFDGTPSTVVDLASDPPRVAREGVVASAVIARLLADGRPTGERPTGEGMAGQGPLLDSRPLP